MKTKLYFALLTICTTMLMSSCWGCNSRDCQDRNAKTKSGDVEAVYDGHNAKNSLDYIGTYKGTLPLKNNRSIEVTLELNELSYTVTVTGDSEHNTKQSGKYSWNEEGNIITLDGLKKLNKFFVGENRLIPVRVNINDIKVADGSSAEDFMLIKQ